MKKLFLIAVLVLCVALAGCSSNASLNENYMPWSDSSVEETAEMTQLRENLGNVLTSDTVEKVVITSVSYHETLSYESDDAEIINRWQIWLTNMKLTPVTTDEPSMLIGGSILTISFVIDGNTVNAGGIVYNDSTYSYSNDASSPDKAQQFKIDNIEKITSAYKNLLSDMNIPL